MALERSVEALSEGRKPGKVKGLWGFGAIVV